MNGYKLFKDLLKEFALSNGIPDLTPDADGYACIAFKDNFDVHLIYDGESEALRLFAELCFVPDNFMSHVMRDLLDANVLWRGSGGATLGLDSGKSVVTMAYQEPIAIMSVIRFEKIFEAFIITGENWVKRIHNIAREEIGNPDLDGMQFGIRV